MEQVEELLARCMCCFMLKAWKPVVCSTRSTLLAQCGVATLSGVSCHMLPTAVGLDSPSAK